MNFRELYQLVFFLSKGLHAAESRVEFFEIFPRTARGQCLIFFGQMSIIVIKSPTWKNRFPTSFFCHRPEPYIWHMEVSVIVKIFFISDESRFNDLIRKFLCIRNILVARQALVSQYCPCDSSDLIIVGKGTLIKFDNLNLQRAHQTTDIAFVQVKSFRKIP